jgi:hypothetical protein
MFNKANSFGCTLFFFKSQIGLINLENEDVTKAIVDTTQANLQVPLFVHYIKHC